MELSLSNSDLKALISPEDLDRVSTLNWRAYIQVRGMKITYVKSTTSSPVWLHRFVLDTSCEIDHVDGDGLNNQRANLRICTHSQNMMNQRKSPNKSSKYKGVSWDKDKERWAAYIYIPERTRLGRYKSEEEAALVYNARAKELFGEFARLNVIE